MLRVFRSISRAGAVGICTPYRYSRAKKFLRLRRFFSREIEVEFSVENGIALRAVFCETLKSVNLNQVNILCVAHYIVT